MGGFSLPVASGVPRPLRSSMILGLQACKRSAAGHLLSLNALVFDHQVPVTPNHLPNARSKALP